MGFTGKAKSNKSSEQNWGRGFLFVFFPEDDQEQQQQMNSNTTILNKKKYQTNTNSLFSSSSSSSSCTSPLPLFKRSNSTHLLSRAQSTISICALLICITLLLFTLSTFEPSTRIQFSQFSSSLSKGNFVYKKQHALQGMGTLYRRGTRAMKDLIIAHNLESLDLHELRLFLRLLYRSSLTSRSDVLFIFSSNSASFDATILEENDSFLKLISQYKKMSSLGNPLNSTGNLNVAQFVKLSKKDAESGEPIWGRRIRSNFSDGNKTESTQLSYGSVVGFDVGELDVENSLAGFLDLIPMSLRRWACYPMLLGRVRRNFKHIMLVDVKEVLLVGDPLSRVRNSRPESVHLVITTQFTPNRHDKNNSEKTQSKSVNPAIIRGGARGIRRLSKAMLIEIYRAAMQHKKKNLVSEFALFNQLVGNEYLLKNVNFITSTESIPELSSLTGSSASSISNFTAVRRGNSKFDVNSTVLKNILCSSIIEISVYSNCL